MPTALIIGCTGQDGSYLSELLIEKGYTVHGLKRRSSSFNTRWLDALMRDYPERLKLHFGDVTDGSSVREIVRLVMPDEIYNLAAQSHVAVSWEIPEYTADTVALGALRVLEALRVDAFGGRFYQASSSEMFGDEPAPQSEETAFAPLSPYAASKVFAHQLTQMYREQYGLKASCGILFNHESPRRGETFVSRKITRAIGRWKNGLGDGVTLGNVLPMRDWGHAKDYVRAMWMMLQHEPDDYVIGTGKSHSVQQFLTYATRDCPDMPVRTHHPNYVRGNEVHHLCADTHKAKTKLGWYPKISFHELIDEMIEHDTEEASRCK